MGKLQRPGPQSIYFSVPSKSFDTRRALKNVEQAEAILRGVRADLLPSLNLNGQINAADFKRVGAGASLSGDWNLDVLAEHARRFNNRNQISPIAKPMFKMSDASPWRVFRRLILPIEPPKNA